MNRAERRMMNEEGFNFLENIMSWHLTRHLAGMWGLGLTLYVSPNRFRYSLYTNLEEPRPRSSRSTRVVRYRDVPRPCNPQSEERVFEIFNELFANAARINHLENMPRDDSRSGEISVSFDAPAPSITERLFTSQDTNESTAKDNTQPVKKTESKPKRIKIKNAIDRLEV